MARACALLKQCLAQGLAPSSFPDTFKVLISCFADRPSCNCRKVERRPAGGKSTVICLECCICSLPLLQDSLFFSLFLSFSLSLTLCFSCSRSTFSSHDQTCLESGLEKFLSKSSHRLYLDNLSCQTCSSPMLFGPPVYAPNFLPRPHFPFQGTWRAYFLPPQA